MKLLLALLPLFVLIPAIISLPSSFNQTQLISLGTTTIANSYQYWSFGSSIAISKDSSTLVIGSNNGGSYGGRVYVYVKNGGDWEKAATLEPTESLSTFAEFGNSVATSSDGSIIVIGAPGQGRNNEGMIFVFTQIGTNRWGESQSISLPYNSNLQYGFSVDISSDGSTIIGTTEGSAVGCMYTLNAGTYTEAYCIPGTQYYYGAQRHNNLDGVVNGDGSIIAMITGNYYNTAGIVNIYAPQTSGRNKYAVVQSLKLDTLCTTLAISDDGSTLVVGASTFVLTGATGGIYWYYRSDSSQEFQLLGSSNSSKTEGNSLALNEDGTILIVGNATHSAVMYQLDPTQKTMTLLQTFEAASAYDIPNYAFGYSVEVSSDGSSVFVGSPIIGENSQIKDDSGLVYFYS